MEEVAEGRSSDRGELDALTNLSDRQSFLSRLIALCVPEPPAGAALLRIDLVRFSRINMALGPRIADRVLKQVAERIRKSAPDAIDVARVSGDGFAVLLDDSQSFKATVDHIVDIVRRPILISGSVVELDAYIGGSSVVDGISDGYDLLQAAEIALAHAAKAPDRAAFYAPGMKADIARTYIIERDLRTTVSRQQRALLAGEPNPNFSLSFQPKVDLRSGQLTGFEALLRFTMIDGTPIPPDDFIPVAEQCGLMHVIGMWVIQSACAALALLPESLSVAVNIAPIQLSRPTFLITNIRDALSRHGISRRRLELELTESELDIETEEAVRDLALLGLDLWIDDFGTGHSSLSRLCSMPFTGLKIDKSITRALTGTGLGMADRLLESIISVATALKMPTVIEGIEYTAQEAICLEAGCTYGQGYLYGMPLSLDDALALIAKFHSRRTQINA